MIYLQAFALAFMATLGLEVALGLCLAIGAAFKGASKNDKH